MQQATSASEAAATAYDIADETLRGLLGGLLTANWNSVCFFTGRYRWRGYDELVGRDTAIHIHLPGLSARQTIMMMDNLSRLIANCLKINVTQGRVVES